MPLKNKEEWRRRQNQNSMWVRNNLITLAKILNNQGFKCAKCGMYMEENRNSRFGLTIQHIKDHDNFDNIEIWCRSCNSKDGTNKRFYYP